LPVLPFSGAGGSPFPKTETPFFRTGVSVFGAPFFGRGLGFRSPFFFGCLATGSVGGVSQRKRENGLARKRVDARTQAMPKRKRGAQFAPVPQHVQRVAQRKCLPMQSREASLTNVNRFLSGELHDIEQVDRGMLLYCMNHRLRVSTKKRLDAFVREAQRIPELQHWSCDEIRSLHFFNVEIAPNALRSMFQAVVPEQCVSVDVARSYALPVLCNL